MVLTIAGSDPGGGAGIQADLKTFGALGAYGCAVLTALTAQNTRGVTGVHAVPPAFVAEQLATLVEDIALDAVKIGMIADAGIADAVADFLVDQRPPHVVLDPVMVATSGDRLLASSAEQVVRGRLLALADVITPNALEAAALLGTEPAESVEQAVQQVDALLDLGARGVLLKGGHLTGDTATDVFAERGGDLHRFSAPRLGTRNTHGTGCTLSSAMAALRPTSPDWPAAIDRAKEYLTAALRAADDLRIGSPDDQGRLGHGPVHHFWQLWPVPDTTTRD
ncbi:bifunctional hydroxymethylpyrimidine kinase/phosphomethylpyrimidine kinase [Nakamurella leprariae]|uniref:Bifunctional hydroxymethylpyrimidine kinase/phosphomethylpyrimidine kinase n=1 Tax=Nakamurella leprariae TaxID=2803911 RepID=A0A939BZT7_9ACTN|nr:bifunctional hydroxymethylpyrimidine kinase/phosphomethylpyrimidine kinase [Nakamurella leprariae]